MIKKKEQIQFKAHTHTVQMKSNSLQAISDEINEIFKLINNMPYMTKNISHTARGTLFPINPNHYIKGLTITSQQDLIRVLENIRQELMIDEWDIDRQDIAIDTDRTFNELFKLNSMFILLFGISTNNVTNTTDTRSKITLKKRALTCHSKKYELQMYDKDDESNGKYKVTRCEFRFKLLTNDNRDKIFEQLYDTLNNIPHCIDTLNKLKIETLYNLWVEHHNYVSDTPISNLTDFFKRYGDEIYTVDIAKGLYERIQGGKYENWIKGYRRNYKIQFFTKSDIKRYCESMIKAVKVYENTPPIITPIKNILKD